MFHWVGILCPSGVLLRTDEPPHWVQSTFGLPDLECDSDLAASAASKFPPIKLQLAIARATIANFFMLTLEWLFTTKAQSTQRHNCLVFSLCALRAFVVPKCFY